MTLVELRVERNSRLENSDYYMLPDVFNKLAEGQQDILLTYRQSLRDLPAQYTDSVEPITEVEWPSLLI